MKVVCVRPCNYYISSIYEWIAVFLCSCLLSFPPLLSNKSSPLSIQVFYADFSTYYSFAIGCVHQFHTTFVRQFLHSFIRRCQKSFGIAFSKFLFPLCNEQKMMPKKVLAYYYNLDFQFFVQLEGTY